MKKNDDEILNGFSLYFKKNKTYMIILFSVLFLLCLVEYFRYEEILTKINEEFKVSQYFIFISKNILELIIITLVLKLLLGMKPFKAAIYEIFKEIFIKKSMLSEYKEEEIKLLAENISKISPYKLDFDESYEKSIKELEIYWTNKKKNSESYVITESFFDTTITSNGQVILTRKLNIKMMEDGFFNLCHYFIPYDEKIDKSRYNNQNMSTNRWEDYCFKFFSNKITKRAPNINVRLDIKKDSEIDENAEQECDIDETWLCFEFSSERKLDKGTEFSLEFLITDKIPTEINDNIIKKLAYYFESKYTREHGIRHIKFQIERFNKDNDLLNIEPFLEIGELHIPNDYTENIYYRLWNWSLYNNKHKEDTIYMKIEKLK